MKKSYILILLISLSALFSCNKEEDKAILSASLTAPTLKLSETDVVLTKEKATEKLMFTGSIVDWGYATTAKYTLQIDKVGNSFKKPVDIASNYTAMFEVSKSELNSILLNEFNLPEFEKSNVEFRIVASVLPSATSVASVNSATITTSYKTYGPPTLLLTGGGKKGVVSELDNKIYTGFVYTNTGDIEFTNPADNKVYGGDFASGKLTVGGAKIKLKNGAGAYFMTVNLVNMTFTFEDKTVCMIGAAIGGWENPNDIRMEYDFTDNSWNKKNVNIVAGGLKFRSFNAWSPINIAYHWMDASDLNKLYQNDGVTGHDSKDIQDLAPGVYDMKLFLGKYPFKPGSTPFKLVATKLVVGK